MAEMESNIQESKILKLNRRYGRRHSEETKRKISESHKGEKHPLWGKHLSEQHRMRLSISHKKYVGEKHWNYGRTQLRVDAPLAAGETWNAAYSGGNTQTIGHEEPVAKNTKINVPFDGLDTAGTLAAQGSWVAPITTGATNIAIQKHSNPGVDAFTAQGTIRAIGYYETFEAMADAP